jgi:hypothetical protein
MGCCTSKTSNGPDGDQNLPAPQSIPLQQQAKLPVATALEKKAPNEYGRPIPASQASITDANVQRASDLGRQTAEHRHTPTAVGRNTAKAAAHRGEEFEDVGEGPMGVDPDAWTSNAVQAVSQQAQKKPLAPTIQSPAISKPIQAKPRPIPNKPLSSWYYPETTPTKPPVSKFRKARDERGMALIRQEELARKEREIRARIADPVKAREAIDELRRNYASKRDVKEHQLDPENRLRGEGQMRSPLAGPPTKEQRREVPSQDNSPYIDFETLRWD